MRDLFYDLKRHPKLFGLGGAIRPGTEDGDRLTKLNDCGSDGRAAPRFAQVFYIDCVAHV